MFLNLLMHFCFDMKLGKLVRQKFGFINGVDNVNWPPYRDSKS